MTELLGLLELQVLLVRLVLLAQRVQLVPMVMMVRQGLLGLLERKETKETKETRATRGILELLVQSRLLSVKQHTPLVLMIGTLSCIHRTRVVGITRSLFDFIKEEYTGDRYASGTLNFTLRVDTMIVGTQSIQGQ